MPGATTQAPSKIGVNITFLGHYIYFLPRNVFTFLSNDSCGVHRGAARPPTGT